MEFRVNGNRVNGGDSVVHFDDLGKKVNKYLIAIASVCSFGEIKFISKDVAI